MRPFNLLAATMLGAGLLAAPAVVCAQTKPPAAAAKPAPTVTPDSIQALELMSSYLRKLQAFELKADIVMDEVGDDGRKLQVGSTATYRVRRPNGFTIELASDRKQRKLFYDGKSITVQAPRVGFYAKAPAPPTIRETLDTLHDKYDFDIPLEDLFRWGEPGDKRDDLTKGFYVGPARLMGVETDQYAFSTGDVDWQIWIERGDKPLPRKIVITSLFDEAQPQFAANLAWNTAPTLSDADFAFVPPADGKAIAFAATTSVK